VRHKSIHDSLSIDGVFTWKHLLEVPHAQMGKASSDADCVTQQMKNGIITGDLNKV